MARLLWLALLGVCIGLAIATARRPAEPGVVSARDSSPSVERGVHFETPLETPVGAPAATAPFEPDSPQPALISRAASSLERFLELRGITAVGAMRKDLTEFVAELRDSGWAPGMEAQFQSELAKSTTTLTDSYVECRRSRCLVLLVHPAGTHRPLVGEETRAALQEHARAASSLNLIGFGAFAAVAPDGSLVSWNRFQRRCGPDWQCLEPAAQ
jgi:hypothetical protein